MVIIGITGTLGAGKGTIVDYLVNKKSFYHYSVSGYLKEELQKQNREIDRTNMQDIANEIREKFAVTANQKIRYERIKLRQSEKDSVSFKEFQRQEEREMQDTDPNAQNLLKCIEMADFLINNDGSLENLYEQIEKI